MPKDYMEELNNELSESGSLDKALENGAAQDDNIEKLESSEQKFVVSPNAQEGLDQFMLKRVGTTEQTIKELLEKGIVDSAMTLSELPAFLKDYKEKLMRGEE